MQALYKLLLLLLLLLLYYYSFERYPAWKWLEQTFVLSLRPRSLLRGELKTGAIWKRFLNGARWKRNLWRCRVNTKSDTFSLRFSAQPPFSQNSLNRFPCCLLCSIWKICELLLICQQIVMASCEHMSTPPLFSRAGVTVDLYPPVQIH